MHILIRPSNLRVNDKINPEYLTIILPKTSKCPPTKQEYVWLKIPNHFCIFDSLKLYRGSYASRKWRESSDRMFIYFLYYFRMIRYRIQHQTLEVVRQSIDLRYICARCAFSIQLFCSFFVSGKRKVKLRTVQSRFLAEGTTIPWKAIYGIVHYW